MSRPTELALVALGMAWCAPFPHVDFLLRFTRRNGRVGGSHWRRYMRMDGFVVTGWRWGRTWGLRVRKEGHSMFQQYRRRLDQEALVVDLPGTSALLRVQLSPLFWRSCPEVRAAEIGRWMCSRGDAPWPRGKPPKYRASLVAGQEIVLRVD